MKNLFVVWQFLWCWIMWSHRGICFSCSHPYWLADYVPSDHARNSFFFKCIFTCLKHKVANIILSRAGLALQQLFCFRLVHSSTCISWIGSAASDPRGTIYLGERGLAGVLFHRNPVLPVCPCTKRDHILSPVCTTCYSGKWCAVQALHSLCCNLWDVLCQHMSKRKASLQVIVVF